MQKIKILILICLLQVPLVVSAEQVLLGGSLYIDTTTGAFGVGTTSLTSLFTVSNSGQLQEPLSNTTALFTGFDNNPLRVSMDSFNSSNSFGSQIQFRRARGTTLSPTAALTDDTIYSLAGAGWGDTGFGSASVGSISMHAGGDFTDASKPTYIRFNTTPSGSVTQVERMRVNPDGSITLATTTAGTLKTTATGIVWADTSGGSGSQWTDVTGGINYSGGKVGVGTSTPWGRLSVLDSNPDYNNPSFTVATSSTPNGQAINVFASSSVKTFGGLFSGQFTGIKIAFGAIKKYFSNFFFNGTVASSWESLECDSFKLIANLSADANDLCGFIDFNETTTAVLNQYTTGGYDGATLQVSAGVTADSAELFMGTVNARDLASTSPKMEIVVAAVTTLSTTTQIVFGWDNSINASTVGCTVMASTTPNWQAVCKTAIATETRVDTGIATSTAYVKFTLELGSQRFLVSAQTTETGDPIEVANITSNIPSAATALQARVGIRRLTLGSSATPTLSIVGLRYYKYSSWWGGGN